MKETEIIMKLASNVFTLYEVNPYTGEYIAYDRTLTPAEAAIRKSMSTGENIYENVERDTDRLIYADDRDRCRSFFSRDNLVAVYEKGETKITELRFLNGDTAVWFKVTVLPLFEDENDSRVVIACEDIDAEKRVEKIETDNLVMKALEDNNSRVLDLDDDFESLYDVNLLTGDYERYGKDWKFTDNMSAGPEEKQEFFTDMLKSVEAVLYPADRDEFIRVVNKNYICGKLDKDNHFDWYYRLYVDEKPTWFRMSVVYKNEDKEKLIIGIFNADEEMAERQKEQHYREEIVNQMMHGESVYLVNLRTSEYKIIHRNRYLSEHYSPDESYNESIGKYIDSDVHEVDRKKMRRVLSLENIAEALKSEKEYTAIYRDISAGISRWYRMRAVGLSDTEILLGFANYDMAYTEDLIHERLKEDYFAMFVADLDTGIVKVIKKSRWYDTVGVGQTVPYAFLLKDLASHFVGETRAFFERLVDIAYVRTELAIANKLACTYKSPLIEGGKWVRVEGLLLTRHEDGTPAVLALGFRLLDALGSEKQELQVKLSEALTVIQAEKKRYDTLHDIIHSGKWSFKINAADEVVSADYSPEVQRLINNDLPPLPYAWHEVLHPDERERIVGAFNAAIADHSGQTLFDETYRMRDRNGNYNWFRSAGKVMRDETGNGEYFGIHVDVSDRIQQAQEQQQQILVAEEMQRFLERIVDKYDVVYKICLKDGTFIPLKTVERTAGIVKQLKDYNTLRKFFVENVVYAPDQELVRQALEADVIGRNNATRVANYTMVEYRSLVNGIVHWNELRVIVIDEENIAIGVIDKTQDILLRNFDAAEDNDYFALFAVDLDSGQLNVLKQATWDKDWAEGESYPYPAVIRKIGSHYQGEIGRFYNRLADLNYVQKWFADKGEKFSYSYESEFLPDNNWTTITGRVIIRHIDGSPAVFMIGYYIMDTLASDSQKVQQQLKENMEMIGGLASGYQAVFYVNIDKDIFKIYSLDEKRLPDTKKLVGESDLSGWETFHRFGCSEAVHPADRRLFAELTKDTTRAKLAHSKKFTVRFRRNFNGQYLWSEMDVVKCEDIEERANTLIVAFAERDAEIRSEKEHEENFARRVAISDYIINSYSTAYYSNISNDNLIVLHIDDKVAKSLEGRITTFSETIDRYITECVHHSDQDKLRAFFVPKNIRTQLAGTETISCDYHDISDTEPGVYRCIIIRGEDENHIFAGFQNVTAEIQKRQEEQEQLKQAREVKELINRFIRNNKATFIVNGTLDTYRSMQPGREEYDIFGTDPSFTRTFERYASRIYEADRERMKAELDLKSIRKRLKVEPNYTIRYRGILQDFTTWFELRFSKLSTELFILAIADVTEAAVKELSQNALSENSYSIFLLDLTTDTVRVVKRAGRYHGESDSNVYRFTEIQAAYIGGLEEKYRKEWEGLDTLEGVQKLLRDEDKRELIYESPYRENRLVRCTWQVIERRGGEASIVCMFFADLDEEQADREKLHVQIAQQLETIGGVASEFISLYHVNLDTGEYKPYTIASRIADIKPYIARNPKFGNMLNEFFASDRVLPEYRERLREFYPSNEGVRAALADKKKLSVIFERNYGGKILWTEGNIIKCEDVNEPAHMAVVGFKEVDEEVRTRMQQQQELEAALKSAEVANSSKTSFLFNMSHDIRTPMNAIKGFTTMAQKYLNDKERVADYLNKIQVSGRQLLNLINQVLEMSRIESGKIELENKPVNIKEKFEPFVTILAEQAKANGQEFHYSLTDIRHYDILADEARMGQITLNIAGNALKYTLEGGKIDFVLKEIPCDKEGWARYTFTVADTGIGMSEEYLKVLFEPFTRERSSTVSHIQGTGLGMSIVKKLVDLLGGKIEVHSELGKGTRFDITADFEIVENNEEKAVSEPNVSVGTESFTGKRILLVEDNELNREIAKDILEEFDFIVEEANDGDVAVEMMKQATDRGEYDYYDLILMDIQMPRMNGYEATKAIRAIPEPTGSHLPIIAMTANAFEEDRKNAIAAGMDDHLAKPIEIEKLLETLAKFL